MNNSPRSALFQEVPPNAVMVISTYLDVDRPIVGRDEEGLERSLVEAARRREELGRDVGLMGI